MTPTFGKAGENSSVDHEAFVLCRIGELEGTLDSVLADIMDIWDYDDGLGSLKSLDEAFGHINRALDILICMEPRRVRVLHGQSEYIGRYRANAGKVRVTYGGQSKEAQFTGLLDAEIAEQLLSELVSSVTSVPEAVQ